MLLECGSSKRRPLYIIARHLSKVEDSYFASVSDSAYALQHWGLLVGDAGVDLLEGIFFPIKNNSSIQLWELHRDNKNNRLEHYEFGTEIIRTRWKRAAFIRVGTGWTDKSDHEISEQGIIRFLSLSPLISSRPNPRGSPKIFAAHF